MRKTLMTLGLAALALSSACKKTGENEYKVTTPDVNFSADTHTVTTPDVEVGSKVDTINTPTIGIQKETLIVNKPVVGTKKTEVRTPTVDVKKP
ncbi:MAG: hypothetical protein ACYC3Q_07700 [Gemmatimonadaceae bacterium]